MHVKLNTEERPHNNHCRGKAIYGRLSELLHLLCAELYRHLCCVRLYYIFRRHTNGRIFEKQTIKHQMCAFSLKILSETVLILRRTQRDIINYISLHVKNPLFW